MPRREAARAGHRRYPRVERVNRVLREVVAEELERRADTDDRLGLLTVTAVKVDPDLRHATVLLASLSDDAEAALADVRVPLQAAIGRQLRIKRTPQLTFAPDPAILTGNRIEDLLRSLPPPTTDDEAAADGASPVGGDDPDGPG